MLNVIKYFFLIYQKSFEFFFLFINNMNFINTFVYVTYVFLK